ncbi:hypothetical protein BC835DRAFT_1352879 [Cytidiella melzeri]|nr:hypothetical protein BC835DRAFT_1352879 [Cytidiella melzeri]
MTGHFVGEIPLNVFVDLLRPAVDSPTPNVDFSEVPQGRGKEGSMYLPFMEAINKSQCCPSFVLKDTSTRKDTLTQAKPDCGLFHSSVAKKVRSSKYPMAMMDVPVEMKPQASQDAFKPTMNEGDAVGKEKEEPITNLTTRSIDHRGQQIDYAAQVLTLQHRSHVFSISIIGHHARLIRWDRAGALVSERFNYVDGYSNWLGEFLFRYEHATPEQRGYDVNVQKATEEEIQLLKTGVNEYLEKFPMYKDSELAATVNNSYPSYKVRVHGEATADSSHPGVVNEYIICQPFTEVSSLCGRATQGYLAWGVFENDLVFLKDTWRTDLEGVMSEAAVYAVLEKNFVPFLPSVLVSGDVCLSTGHVQCTLTQDYAEGYAWSRPTAWLRRHVRHRVVQHLALPLRMVRNSKELVRAIRNVLEVIKRAHEANILHRDISAGNIMLDKDFNGILNDWDHAINTLNTGEGHAYRTGTWQFMSIPVLQNAKKVHTIHDDVESAFWVFYYTALHYFSRDTTSAAPNMGIFDECDEVKESHRVVYKGGSKKLTTMISREIQGIIFESKPLTRAIHGFAAVISDYHVYCSALLPMNLNPSPDTTSFVYPFMKAVKTMENVDDILKIFDDAIASTDWPEVDDAVKDQYPKKTKIDTHRDIDKALHESFKQSFQSAGSAVIPPSQKASSSSALNPSASLDPASELPSNPLNRDQLPTANVKRLPLPTKQPRASEALREGLRSSTRAPIHHAKSLPVGSSAGLSTGTKRSHNDEEAGLEEGTSDGRVKRTRRAPKEMSPPSTRYNTRSRTRQASEEGKKKSGARSGSSRRK